MSEKIKRLQTLVEKIYLKIYYLSEKEYSSDDIVRKEVDDLVNFIIKYYPDVKSEIENIKSVEWVYYNDIEAFWTDAERRKNLHHSWLILSEYIPTMYKEIKEFELRN